MCTEDVLIHSHLTGCLQASILQEVKKAVFVETIILIHDTDERRHFTELCYPIQSTLHLGTYLSNAVFVLEKPKNNS